MIEPPTLLSGLRTGGVRFCQVLMLGLFVFAAVSACQSGPPVQEMSDARQAINVAKRAGAAEKAAEQLKDAQNFLDRAEQRLSERAYADARRDALEAKRSALDALSITEEFDSSN